MSLPFLCLPERKTEQLQECAAFFIVLCCGYEGNVHTAWAIDLILFDFWEYNLLG
jgi:hypothetical protein